MNKYPLVSIIVPIYMIDRYIGKCIESILEQTYKNIEIILVNDGSKDRCRDICDLYASKDTRIKVVHKSNSGLVSARKAGLNISRGDYISYVDGDDWIASGFIESMLSEAITYNADIVCAGYTRDLFDQSVSVKNFLPVGIYADEQLEILRNNMLSSEQFYCPGITTYVWNKLFKKDILLEPQLSVDDNISIGEDAAVTYPAIMKCSRIVIADNMAYHYRQREDSMLKQHLGYVNEVQKLRYLYDYMTRWAEKMPAKYMLKEQVVDYLLSLCFIRSGGISHDRQISAFKPAYHGKNIVVYSAGTFGQHIVSCFRETGLCKIIAWIDDDYREYRRCGMDVDPVEKLTQLSFDYLLIATVVPEVSAQMVRKALVHGVNATQVLTVSKPKDAKSAVGAFLNGIQSEESKGIYHA